MPDEALFTQGGSYDAAELRKLISGIWSAPAPGGVVSGMVVTVGAGTSVNVSAGYVFIYDAAGGAYLGYTTSATNLAISSNSGGGATRNDTIQATISDPGTGGSAGTVILSVKTNTSSVDALSIPLATVSITTANAISISTPSRKTAEIQNDANRTSTAAVPAGWSNAATTYESLAARLANIEKGIVADTHDMYVDLDSAQTLLNKNFSDPSNTFPAAPGVFPAGMVMDYAGSSAPTGWVLCDGAPLSRTTFAALFAVIGTSFGAGDGVNTFNVPDLRGRVTAGTDSMGGAAAGRLTGTSSVRGAVNGADSVTLTEANMPAHNHGGTITSGSNSVGHTHSGPSHSHGGATTGQSQNHEHGTYAHSHGIHAAGEHWHYYETPDAVKTPQGSTSGGVAVWGSTRGTYGTAAAGSHSHGMDAAAPNTGSANRDHTHGIYADGTQQTGQPSNTHTHTVSIATNGSGAKVSNVQPTMQMNKIIKS